MSPSFLHVAPTMMAQRIRLWCCIKTFCVRYPHGGAAVPFDEHTWLFIPGLAAMLAIEIHRTTSTGNSEASLNIGCAMYS